MRAPRRSLPLATALVTFGLLAGAAAPVLAWHTAGHSRVAMAAVRALPAAMPAFFRDGAWEIGQAAVDPDLMKDRQLPALDALIWPDHFLDSELLQGATLPPDRWAYVAMLQTKNLTASKLGTLPYAVIEHEEELTMTLAEYRRWPRDPAVRHRALVYAGWLAHYAGDLDQPLHTTVDHDGRALPDGSSPFTGIHFIVDDLFEKTPLDARAITHSVRPRAYDDPWQAVLAELASSHALVDVIYRLEPELRASFAPPPAARPTGASASGSAAARATNAGAATTTPATSAATAAPAATPRAAAATSHTSHPRPTAAVIAFSEERFRATTTFIANLYWTAWQRSAAIQLPAWDRRPGPGRWDVGRSD